MKIRVELDLSINMSQEVYIEAVSQADFDRQLEEAKQDFLDNNLPTIEVEYDNDEYDSLPERTAMGQWKRPKNNLELPLGV